MLITINIKYTGIQMCLGTVWIYHINVIWEMEEMVQIQGMSLKILRY